VKTVTEPGAAKPGLAEPNPRPRRTPRPLALAAALPDRLDTWLEAHRRSAWALTAVLTGVVSVIVVVPAAIAPGGLSPVDEYVYVDAVAKADHGELSNVGDKVDGYARQVMACRGVIGWQEPTETCGMRQVDATLPLSGFTSADVHPPTYYFLTAAGSKVVRALGITDDLLIAARLVGALWLMLGMLALVALGRAWGARWVVPVWTAVAVGTTPLLVSVSGYLSPDALGLLVGSGVLLAVTQWQRGRLHWALLLLMAALPAFIKVPFVLAPLFGAVLLFVAALAGQIPWRRALIGAPILVSGAGAGAVLWQLIRTSLAVAVPATHGDAEQPVAISSFASYFGYYLETIPVSSGAPLPVSPLLAFSVQPLAWLLLAAAIGGMLFRRRQDPLLPVCWAGTSGMVLGSIILSLIVLVASGGFLIGLPRYGLALLPLFAIPLMCTRHPLAVWGVVASACGGVLAHLLLW
jgi:hypothetical protein